MSTAIKRRKVNIELGERCKIILIVQFCPSDYYSEQYSKVGGT